MTFVFVGEGLLVLHRVQTLSLFLAVRSLNLFNA